MRFNRFLMVIVVLLLTLPRPTTAQVFWIDDFNTDTSEDYEVLLFNLDRDVVEFDFDYSTLGIPEAPNSTAGGTTGVQFFANRPFEDTTGRASAVQIAPLDLEDVLDGQDFTLTYDVWMNVNGPLPAGGGGSTQAMMAGVGFDGITPIEAGIINGTYFTLTGEAGATTTDVRSFTNDPPDGFNQSNEDGSPINVASVDLDDEYYHGIFPGGIDASALPVQGGRDNQTGVTRPGQMAFQWHEVRIDVRGPEVSFYVDDLLIARDKDASIEGTVFVGHADYFTSVADVWEWNFSIADNLKVFGPSTLTGDYNENGELDAPDLDLQAVEISGGENPPAYDLNGDELVDFADRQVWVNDLKNTWIGDANLDGEFNSSDMVQVFVRGKYETGEGAGWEEGDWNGDTTFGSSDMVAAFAAGGYEQGERPGAAVGAVPEPSSWLLLTAGLGLVTCRTRRRR